MVATTHVLVGAACALRARSPVGGLAIGVLTHLALDAVPHRDYSRDALGGLALTADLTAAGLAVWSLSDRSEVVLAGALGGVLPDVVRVAERSLGVKLTSWAHDTVHTAGRPPAWRSAAVQGLTAATAALALSRSSRGRRPRPLGSRAA